MKIGNTTFNQKHIKEMTEKQFIDTYSKVLRGDKEDLKAMYQKLCGKRKIVKKQETKEDE